MNQILYNNSDKKRNGPLEMNVVLRIFAILCILFGIVLAGKGAFALANKKEKIESIPTVEIAQQSNILQLNVKHDKLIDKVIYSWNNEQKETVLQGKGRLQMVENIELPLGKNTLKLKVVDIEGHIINYTNEYTLEEGDFIEPEIELLLDGSKVKIVAKDETEIDHIEYYWNEEDSTTINANENSPKQIEERISILKGENTLHIVAVDKSGNKSQKDQIYKGATKPVINVSKEDKTLIITVNDEENIKRIDYVLNDVYYSTDPNNTGNPLNMKELTIRQELSDGENKITIKAINTSGLETEVSAEPTV